MSLAPSDRLGPYEILAPIGAGGMGEVYKARDTRLDRIVALKVSSENFNERFDREARAIAALNHSNICRLYDVGPDYLVMEYIDGQPLKGPLPLDQALKYAAQICDALDAAHRKNIVHRDLKPANILVTKSGLKLLDFGLAKMEPAVAAAEATMTLALTGKGQILGTLHYMSPEQLHGQAAGPSSDIFSFGLVFYEMLTGRRAFEGPSPASVIAAILERDAPALTDSVPAAIGAVLSRCLAKDPADRWQSAHDLKIALELAGRAAPQTAAPPASGKHQSLPYLAAAIVAGLAALTLAWVHFREVPPEPLAATFEIVPPEAGHTTTGGTVISPNGRLLAFPTSTGVMLRRLDSTSFQNLAGTAGARGLSWSRDSRFLAFSMGSTLKRIDINGGPPQDLCDFPSNNPPFTAWSPAGAILFSGPDGGIWRVSSAGGAPAPVTSSNPSGQGSELHMAPQVLPDGRHFLYLAQADRAERNGIFAGSLDAPSGQPGKLILNSIWSGIYAPGLHGLGSLLLRRGSSLVAQPFDLAGLALAGEPVPVAPEVASYGPLLSVSVSDNGTLVYTAKRADGADNRLLWLDREGKRLGEAGQPGTYLDYNLSPDEKRIAAARIDANNVMDIWILDLGSGGVQTRFTFAPAQFFRFPVWSPDGTRIIFASSRGAASGGTFEKPANGTGAERRIAEGVGFPTDWSRDGRFILSASAGDLWVQTDGKATRITQTSFNEQQAQFSPDGKWIAYVSDESRRNEVWVMSYPPTGARFQVSTAGGRRPRWRGDGRELFYIAADSRMMATAVKTSPNFELGATAPLFQVEDSLGYAVTADGRRFLMRTNLKENAPPPITVMTDWLSAVKH